MKTLPLMLSAAVVAFAGGVGHAATQRDVSEYLQRASVQATADTAAAGVDPAATLVIKARVGSDGRLNGAHVTTSSGSLDTDQQAAKALRRLKVSAPPVALIGAEVRVTVGPAPIVQAKAP